MSKTADNQLFRVAETLVHDILAMSDEDIVAEANEDGLDVSAEAERLRALMVDAKLQAGKAKLREAQRQVSSGRAQREQATPITDIQVARRMLAKAQRSDESIHQGLMLAARKANTPIDDLSDNDVLSLANDLRELGLWNNDE